jgi:hypothetical protein
MSVLREFINSPWGTSVPVYSSRPDSDNRTFTWSTTLGWAFVIGLLIQFNIVLWGLIGLVKALVLIVGVILRARASSRCWRRRLT